MTEIERAQQELKLMAESLVESSLLHPDLAPLLRDIVRALLKDAADICAEKSKELIEKEKEEGLLQ